MVVLILAIIAFILTRSNRTSYVKWIFDRVSADVPIFLDLFRDINHLKDYLILLQNEMGYLVTASYFIFFFLSVMFFFSIFSLSSQKSLSPALLSWYKCLGVEKRCSLKSTSIYYLLTSIVLILTTTLSVYSLNWEIIGRYVDPICPGLFLFGLISLFHMNNASEKQDIKSSCDTGGYIRLNFLLQLPRIDTEYNNNFLYNLSEKLSS